MSARSSETESKFLCHSEQRSTSHQFYSLGERVQMARRADVQRVVGDRRRGGDALAQRRILGDDFRLRRAGLEHRDRAVGERREVDVSVGGDRRGVVAAGGDGPLLVELFAGGRIVGGDDAAVLDHHVLSAIENRRRHVRQALGLLPEHVASAVTSPLPPLLTANALFLRRRPCSRASRPIRRA